MKSPSTPKRELSLLDSTSLIVGIIVGAGIYEMAPDIAKGAASMPALFGEWPLPPVLALFVLWVAGGLVSLCGALGYAELATAYPQEGGDYVYLKRAYGRWAGFLFGWIQLVVARPGDIIIMAFIFGNYATQLWDPFPGSTYGSLLGSEVLPSSQVVYSIAAIVVFTAIHVWGVREGKWTQNVLTSAKVLGLLGVVVVALVGSGASGHAAPADVPFFPWRVALILILFTFGGWNEMAYVAAEVRDPRRNIVRALVLGTLAVTVLYLLANTAFLAALGFPGMASSGAVATDTVATVFPTIGARLISALICVSALGALSGLTFTGARISYAVGSEHRVFRKLGNWNDRTGTPMTALIVQAIIAVALVLILGSVVTAIIYTAFAVYAFYLATSVALFVLRAREPEVERPYRVTWFPLPTLLFCGACLFMMHGAYLYKPDIAHATVGILCVGVVFHRWSRWLESRETRD